MKVSTKGRYGLRVMMDLSASYGAGPVLVDAIARRQEISGKYLHVIMGGLRSAGLVRTARGRNGGYTLAKPPAAITALEVVSALEGRCAPVDCVGDASACARSGRCTARDLWCDVAAAIDGVLRGVTLADLSSKQQARTAAETAYSI
jgi:Rrf2 family transcriptional regulator, cysteine metabolism repressor